MADDQAIRSALRTATGWSAQSLSNRVSALTRQQLMSRTHALYVLAHWENVNLEKYGVDDTTLIEVGKLAAASSGTTQPRAANQTSPTPPSGVAETKPTPAAKFATRSLHPNVVHGSRKAFTSGLHQESVRKAFQSVNNRVKRLTGTSRDGMSLVGWAFNDSPQLQMTDLATESEENEHNGLRFLMQGAMLGVRNPRAHEDHWGPDSDENSVLELLSFASYLHRCLDRCETHGSGQTQ